MTRYNILRTIREYHIRRAAKFAFFSIFSPEYADKIAYSDRLRDGGGEYALSNLEMLARVVGIGAHHVIISPYHLAKHMLNGKASDKQEKR